MLRCNYAFIDNQNLYCSCRDQGWKIDYGRLYSWLKNKYQVTRAFMFIGYIESNEALYTHMRESGFDIIFRPTLQYKDQSTKGNCDAELVMQVILETNKFDQAIVISGDGDFYSLYKYLIAQNKPKRLLIPNQKKYSSVTKTIPTIYYFPE